MTKYSTYRLSDGRIVGRGQTSNFAAKTPAEGEGIIAGHFDPHTQMIDVTASPPAVIDRPQADQDADALRDAKRAARLHAQARFQAFEASFLSGVPAGERLSWGRKEAAAERYEAGTATPRDLSLLQAEGAAVGRTEAEVAASILAKADAYAAAVGQLSGVRQAVLDAIEAATTVAEVNGAPYAALAALDP